MNNPLSQIIDPAKVFELQRVQYRDSILLADTVPANSSKLGSIGVSNLGHFYCMFVTGTFETLWTNAVPAIVDNGVSALSGRLEDGAGNRKLFSDRIPLDLWLSPGRRKSTTSTGVLTDPVSNNLFYPVELEYLFGENTNILLDVVNSSNADIHYEIMFHGVRIISNAAAEACRKKLLQQQQG